MTKRVLLVLLALALVVSLVAFAACAKEEEEEEEEVWEWPQRLLLTVMSTYSPNYGAFVAWSTPLSKDTGMTVRIITESDSRLQQLWVKGGRFFAIGMHQNRDQFYGSEGNTRRDWGPWMSSIWIPGGLSYWSFCVWGDSGIKTPYDIKPGMKACMMTLAEEVQQAIYGLLAWAQVDPEDIVMVPLGSTRQNCAFLIDGRVDFTVGYHTSPGWYEAEAAPHGLSWIELDWEKDPEGAQRFLDYYPWTSWGIATGGVPTSEGVPMTKELFPLITRFDTDPELVYRIVKWLDENYDRYKEGNPWCADMTMDNLIELAKFHYEPIHDGAVRYLEEKGLWTEELETRRQYNIELMTLWVEAYQAAIKMADERGIDVNPDNAEWQELWENYREEHNLPLLVWFQEPGKEQPVYSDFYTRWNEVKPKF